MKKGLLNTSLLFFITVITVIGIMSWSLINNYSDYFDEVESKFKNKDIIDLSKPISTQFFSNFLLERNYVDSQDDALFIAQIIKKRLDNGETIEDIDDFKKNAWRLTIEEIKKNGSTSYKNKVLDIQSEKENLIKSMVNIEDSSSQKQNGIIRATVVENREPKGRFDEIVNRLLKKEYIPCEGVVVRLSEHSDKFISSLGGPDSIIGYKKTNKDGNVIFSGLDLKKSYSVLPISVKYQYGSAKGTFGGSLDSVSTNGMLIFKQPFIQRPITLPLFSNSVLNKIKKDQSIIVRSPNSFKKAYWNDIVLIIFSWIVLYAILSFISQKANFKFEKDLITCIAFLTSVNIIMMYSMTDPLTDRLIGGDTAIGIEIGIGLMFILFFFNIINFYQGKYRLSFDWLSNKYSTIPKGLSYVLIALFLTLLLFTPLGQEVGGMKVNLNFGFLFQPSEIAKYLVVIFMAAFFSVHENAIIKYSQEGNAGLFRNKIVYMWAIIIGLGLLILLYMFLGDMGPGLVIAISFVLLYSSVKSKINLQNNNTLSISKFLTSDIMLLFAGVLSFCSMLFIGNSLGCAPLFTIIWYILWILGGLLLKKQIYESPIMFNLIITLFVFGGRIFKFLSNIPYLEVLQSIGDRLDSRSQMCLNTWGELGLGDSLMKAGENTQVAEGLWALASGGFWGQGIGEGFPNRIPAFHTDMILSSIGENLGFIYILLIIFTLSILLKRSLNVGYRTENTFGLYLVMGIVIVTAIQFFIIALGSTGVIPLTGVTVPFLSYGKVSLILNMAAFDMILSMSKKTNNTINIEGKSQITKEYRYTIASMSLIYLFIALCLCSTYCNYQLINRDNTLIRPLFVTNSKGAPVIEYNPRISILTDMLYPGNIYDRNGIILATNNIDTLRSHIMDYEDCNINIENLLLKGDNRLYPFKEHLFFMLGDLNEQLLSENLGYMADGRHLSYLRGFDNLLYDEQRNPIKLRLTSTKYYISPFLPAREYTTNEEYCLRDYSMLLPILKNGLKNRDRIENINNRISSFWHTNDIVPKDLHLTVDAKLQFSIQEEMQRYVEKNYSGEEWRYLRMSAVILDAQSGDLLTSANYPLPNINTLKGNSTSYSDNNRNQNWQAYTDMDLGLKYPTAPGSTAKVMSALAGIKKIGMEATKQNYFIRPIERIEVFNNGGGEPHGIVSMEKAIVISSNCYFINLVNRLNLYKELSELYKTVGVQCNFNFMSPNGKFNPILPYSLMYPERKKESVEWNNLFEQNTVYAINKFDEYINKKKYRKINDAEWQLAWGQGLIVATPLAMCRVASVVARNGQMPITNYVIADKLEKKEMGYSIYESPYIQYIDKTNESAVSVLSSYMVKQAQKYEIGKFYKNKIGGKTGTPERIIYKNGKKRKLNDGWYICYIRDCKVNGHNHDIAIAVRMERLYSGLSGRAMALVKDVILPQLAKYNYIQYK